MCSRIKRFCSWCYKSLINLTLGCKFNEIIRTFPVLITYILSQQKGERFCYFLVSNIRLHDFHRVDHRQISILIKSRFLREQRERLSRDALSATRLKFNYTRRSMKWSNILRPPPSFPCLLVIVKFIFVWSLIARCNRVSTATFLLIYPSTARRGSY